MSCFMTLWSEVGFGIRRGGDEFLRNAEKSTVTHRYRVMDDHFRPIDGYPAYRVSRNGEVQSRWSRTVHKTLTDAWLTLKPVRRGRYLTVNLSDGTRKRRRYIHRLVLE